MKLLGKKLDTQKEKAWVTFLDEGFETTWFPLMAGNKQLDFHSEITMDLCREEFKDRSWGIAPTSQMLMQNAVRDNF
tara:strand:+ start:159 stop:389 length:231 start_codon:yes stop_codon:yes gene_type:complete